jgi:putative transposase
MRRGLMKWSSAPALGKQREIDVGRKAAYSSPRIYRQLKGETFRQQTAGGTPLMRETGLRGRHEQRVKGTVNSKHALPVAPNRLEPNFATGRPDQAWRARSNRGEGTRREGRSWVP